MGEHLARLAAEEQRKSDRARRDSLPPQERAALRKIRREAKTEGSLLTSGGKGGLPPSLVLGIFRRDKYRCKVCGDVGSKDNGGLQLHHKAGVVSSARMSRMGHKNEPSAITTICRKCHDSLHTEAREDGIDSSQITPEGDK